MKSFFTFAATEKQIYVLICFPEDEEWQIVHKNNTSKNYSASVCFGMFTGTIQIYDNNNYLLFIHNLFHSLYVIDLNTAILPIGYILKHLDSKTSIQIKELRE